MNCTDWEVVEEVLELLRVSPVWKYRDLAAKLLILLGNVDNLLIETRIIYAIGSGGGSTGVTEGALSVEVQGTCSKSPLFF